MSNFLCMNLVTLILCSTLGTLSGTVFNQFDYKTVNHFQDDDVDGVHFKLVSDTSSTLDCATSCTELGHLTFSYEKQTNTCRTFEGSIDENYSANISSTVTYFTREVCSTIPSLSMATASNASEMVIITTNGTVLYLVGAQVEFTCMDNYYFLGGICTCTSSGTWTGESTPIGCTVMRSGGCVSDGDCVMVSSSVCTNGLCVCQNGTYFDSEHEACITDCLNLYETGRHSDGVYEIKPDGSTPVQVYCDMSNGGWTVFQKQALGDVEFATASWSQMVNGLGSPVGDHWLGLSYIHMLTWTDSQIHFDLVLLNNSQIYFQYTNFRVGNSSTLFEMSVTEEYLSNAYSYADYAGFYAHNLMKFTTVDSDNDLYVHANCAAIYGPWWHRQCGVFGAFNSQISDMNFWNVPMVGRVYVKSSLIKIRRKAN